MPECDLIEQIVTNKPTLTRDELSQIVGMPVQSLASLACKKKGPAFIRLGRAVRYPRAGVIAWMRQGAFNPTV